MARNEPQINLRVPPELKDSLAIASKEKNRSLTSEIVARLQASFQNEKSLPFAVQQAVADEMVERNCTETEALINLVLAGQTQGGKVLNIRVAPGTTAKDVRDAISAALELVPPDTSVVFEREAKG